MIGRFLAGIGALLWNPADDTYLLLRRAAAKDFGAGNWECVTGRVDQGEGFEDALRREVREELGVAVTIELLIGTTHFYRGAPGPETEMIGVLYGCTTPDPAAVRLSDEHSECRWVTATAARALLAGDNASHRWLLGAIERAEVLRAHLPPALRDYIHAHGFETDTPA